MINPLAFTQNYLQAPEHRVLADASLTRSQSATPDSWATSTRYYLWGSVCLIAIIVLSIYSNNFSAGFLYDDQFVIVDNPTIRHLWPQRADNTQIAVLTPETAHVSTMRPVTNWTFALNYSLGGLDPFGYHLFNVLLHLSNALLVFGIVRKSLLSQRLNGRWGKHSLLLALSIALLWASHPVQTNAVAYLAQRVESLAVFFYLATLYCFIRGSEPKKNAWLWLTAAVIAAFLGMGSKETMVTAPVVILLYDRALVSGSFKKALSTHSELYFGLVAAWVFLAILLITGQTASIGINARGGISDPWVYAATQLGVVLHYLKLTVWPDPLIFDNYWPAAQTASAILLPGVVVAAMAGVILRGLITNQVWAFVAGCFFIILSPSSSFVPVMDEYVNEYRMYLPVLASIALLVLGFYAGLQRLRANTIFGQANEGAFDRHVDFIFIALIACIAIALSVATYGRNGDYANGLIMWSDNVKKTPSNPRAHNNFGVELFENNQKAAGIEAFKKAIDIFPQYTDAHYNLALILANTHQLDAAGLEAAGESFKNARRFSRDQLKGFKELQTVLRQLAFVRLEAGDIAGAVLAFKELNSLNSKDEEVKHNLQAALNRLALEHHEAGNQARAVEVFKEVLQINPDNVDAKRNLALLVLSRRAFECFEAGNMADAVLALKELNSLDSKHEGVKRDLQVALNRLAIQQYEAGNKARAVETLKEVLHINPDNADAKRNIAILEKK